MEKAGIVKEPTKALNGSKETELEETVKREKTLVPELSMTMNCSNVPRAGGMLLTSKELLRVTTVPPLPLKSVSSQERQTMSMKEVTLMGPVKVWPAEVVQVSV